MPLMFAVLGCFTAICDIFSNYKGKVVAISSNVCVLSGVFVCETAIYLHQKSVIKKEI